MSAAQEVVREALNRHARFEEALLIELRLVNHGYSVELDFNLVLDAEGRVRPNLRNARESVTLRLDGVTSLELVGGLSDAMLAHPEKINWGLSEIALVEVDDTDLGPQLRVLWEGSRRIVIYFRSAAVFE